MCFIRVISSIVFLVLYTEKCYLITQLISVEIRLHNFKLLYRRLIIKWNPWFCWYFLKLASKKNDSNWYKNLFLNLNWLFCEWLHKNCLKCWWPFPFVIPNYLYSELFSQNMLVYSYLVFVCYILREKLFVFVFHVVSFCWKIYLLFLWTARSALKFFCLDVNESWRLLRTCIVV
jgi:hypothetical protein